MAIGFIAFDRPVRPPIGTNKVAHGRPGNELRMWLSLTGPAAPDHACHSRIRALAMALDKALNKALDGPWEELPAAAIAATAACPISTCLLPRTRGSLQRETCWLLAAMSLESHRPRWRKLANESQGSPVV